LAATNETLMGVAAAGARRRLKGTVQRVVV
jgi:hypothetical protein